MSEPANGSGRPRRLSKTQKNSAKMNALAACKTLATSARPVRDSDACGKRDGTLDGGVNFTVDPWESKHHAKLRLGALPISTQAERRARGGAGAPETRATAVCTTRRPHSS